MRLSRDKVNKLAHVVSDALADTAQVEFLEDRNTIRLEVRSGLRKIQLTAVVRNIGPDGNGVEFVHMKQEDHERLRKLVQKHL